MAGNREIVQAIDNLRLQGLTTTSSSATGPLTDNSGTLTGSSQQASPAGTRKYLYIENPASNAHSIWIRFGATAAAAHPSKEIKPGGAFVWENFFIPNQQLNVIGTNTEKFILWEA